MDDLSEFSVKEVLQTFIASARRPVEKLAAFTKKEEGKPLHIIMMKGLVETDVSLALEYAKKMMDGETRSLEFISQIVDVFDKSGQENKGYYFVADTLRRNNMPDEVQKKLLNKILHAHVKVADEIIRETGLAEKAFQHYLEHNEPNRAISYTDVLTPEWLVNYFARKEMTTIQVIRIYEQANCYNGLFAFLEEKVSQDPNASQLYLETAFKAGHVRVVEGIIRDNIHIDPERVKNFLKEAKQDEGLLFILGERFPIVMQDIFLHLIKTDRIKEVEIFVQQVNPSKLPTVVGVLLDEDCAEENIQQLIHSVAGQFQIRELIQEVEKRGRLLLLKDWLEILQKEDHEEPFIYNALAKIYIDSNNNPEQFLRDNKLYDRKEIEEYLKLKESEIELPRSGTETTDEELPESYISSSYINVTFQSSDSNEMSDPVTPRRRRKRGKSSKSPTTSSPSEGGKKRRKSVSSTSPTPQSGAAEETIPMSGTPYDLAESTSQLDQDHEDIMDKEQGPQDEEEDLIQNSIRATKNYCSLFETSSLLSIDIRILKNNSNTLKELVHDLELKSKTLQNEIDSKRNEVDGLKKSVATETILKANAEKQKCCPCHFRP